jgi:hypothetical protein
VYNINPFIIISQAVHAAKLSYIRPDIENTENVDQSDSVGSELFSQDHSP